MPDIITALQARFPRVTPRASADLPAVNAPADDAVALLRCLRDEHGFDHLADLTAIDWAPGASPRFTVVWHVFSHATHDYLRVAADCASDTAPEMPSVTALWPAANWHERETYDLLGVTFTGHPDLRRILMWDGYAHHPLRKDFPLAGIETGLWDADVAGVVGAKVIAAPMAGGPFTATPGGLNMGDAEPRAKDESWSEDAEKPRAEGPKN
jgi:NADH-quinone oxidoreductase subunit C